MPEHPQHHEPAGFLERMVDLLLENLSVMKREASLFAGATLFILGLFNFNSGKYCDGNTADYLSCTNPTTYYYYGGVEVAAILIGVLLILVWHVKNRRGR